MADSRRLTPHSSRQKLDYIRKGYRYEASISGRKFYLTLSFYPDGRLGELFIDLGKEGAEVKLIYAQLSMMASRLLQYGMAPEKLVSWWRGTKASIQGMLTGTGLDALDGIEVGSILDAIARIIELEVIHEKQLQLSSNGAARC